MRDDAAVRWEPMPEEGGAAPDLTDLALAPSLPPLRVLVLNGSPHRANSSTMHVTRAFAEGMEAARPCVTETVHIADLDVRPCRGCLSCWGRTEGDCIIRDDDIPRMKEKVLSADVIIESFPLYFFGMPGQMKLFTDRMLCMMRTFRGQTLPQNGGSLHGIRYEKPGRRLVLISGCAYTEAEQVYEPLLRQFDYICGAGRYTAILCPQLKTLIDVSPGPRYDRARALWREAGSFFARHGGLDSRLTAALRRPPFPAASYRMMMGNFWRSQKEDTHES